MKEKAKKKNSKLTILIIILTASVIAILVLAGLWLHETITTRQGQQFFDTLAIDFAVNQPVQVVSIIIDDHGQEIEVIEYVRSLPQIDFDALRETMPSIIGWIQSYGTNINYPIMQYTDNDFYLNHLPDRRRHVMGSIYMDYRNEGDFSSPFMMIYGHNMASGDKFSSLRHYTDHQYFLDHDTMLILTPDANFELLIFAGYNINSSMEHPPMEFDHAGYFYHFIDDLLRRSFINSDIRPEWGDQLVYLVTCIYTGASPWRRVVVGILVEIE